MKLSVLRRRSKTKQEKEENIQRKKNIFWEETKVKEGKERKYLEKYFFSEEKRRKKKKENWICKISFWKRRKTEKEREENIWRRKKRKIFGEGTFFDGEEKRIRKTFAYFAYSS